MELFKMILWVIYPYTVLIIVMLGRLWKCDYSLLYNENKTFEKISKLLYIAVKALLWLSLLSGAASLFVSGIGNDFIDMVYWGISFISFRPNMDLIEQMSVLTQMHMVVLFTFFLVLSFTMFFGKTGQKRTIKMIVNELKAKN